MLSRILLNIIFFSVYQLSTCNKKIDRNRLFNEFQKLQISKTNVQLKDRMMNKVQGKSVYVQAKSQLIKKTKKIQKLLQKLQKLGIRENKNDAEGFRKFIDCKVEPILQNKQANGFRIDRINLIRERLEKRYHQMIMQKEASISFNKSSMNNESTSGLQTQFQDSQKLSLINDEPDSSRYLKNQDNKILPENLRSNVQSDTLKWVLKNNTRIEIDTGKLQDVSEDNELTKESYDIQKMASCVKKQLLLSMVKQNRDSSLIWDLNVD